MQRVPHHFGPSPRLHCRYMNELIDSFRCGIDRQHHVKYMAETHGGYFKCRGIIQPNNAHCPLPMLDSIFFLKDPAYIIRRIEFWARYSVLIQPYLRMTARDKVNKAITRDVCNQLN
jgi:hypothetical protein